MTERKCTAVGPRLHTHQGQLMLSFPIDQGFVIELAKTIVDQQFERLSEPLLHHEQVQDFLTVHLGSEEREVFYGVFLDTQLRVIAIEALFAGTIDQAMVYTREIIKTAFKYNAASVIVAHNHPSGAATPSQADVILTDELAKALALVQIKLRDHWVVAGQEITSVMHGGQPPHLTLC